MTTKTIRAAVYEMLDRSSSYDPDTMQIARNGDVSALKTADKTYAGHDATRYLVANVADLVGPDGQIREGY